MAEPWHDDKDWRRSEQTMARPADHKGPSQRQLRVGELVRHALADALTRGGLNEPVLKGVLVTIAEVRMTPDLKHATAYVTVIGGKDDKEAVAALNRKAKALRGMISPALRQMRSMPDVSFRIDTRFEDDARIDAILRSPEVQRDLAGDDEAKS